MVKVSKWTEQEEQYLIKWWHRKSNKEIGNDLGKTESNVKVKANELITIERMFSRKWSDYEEQLLQKLYGHMSIEELSSRMKRTPRALEEKIKLLEGTSSVLVLQPVYNTSDVAGFLGITKVSVTRRINKGKIPFYKIRSHNVIKQDVFWNWLKDNLDQPNYKMIKEEYELDSPEWYRDIIVAKKKELHNVKVGQKWSSHEDALLWSMMMKGIPYKEIAEELKRGFNSICHRASYLSKKKMKVVS